MKYSGIRVVSNSVWLIADRIFKVLVKFLVTMYLANYLGSDLFGKLNFALAVVTIFFSVASLGLSGILIKDFVQNPLDAPKILWNTLIMKLIGGTFSIILIFLYLFITDIDGVDKWLICVLLMGFLLRGFEVFDFWFESNLNSKISVACRFVSFTVISIFQVLGILLECSVYYFAVTLSLEFVLIAFSYLIVYLRRSQLTFEIDFKLWLSLLNRSWPLILSYVGAVIYLKVDQLMIDYFLNSSALGVYSVAVQLSEVWYFIPTTLAASIFPLLVARSNQLNFRDILRGAYSVMLLLGIFTAIVVNVIGPFIIKTFYSNQYFESASILSIHIWASVFVFVRSVFNKWIVLNELYRFSLVTHLIGAVVNVTLNIFFIPKYGVIGAAYATLIAYASYCYFSFLFMNKTRGAFIDISLSFFRAPYYIKVLILELRKK